MSQTRMVINYVPGEECRIAIVEDGRVEEYFAERTDAISRVNNIYSGVVKNVETGIQAAFVDFGIGEAGFLHISDLHPRYFPGADEDEAERVGMKTPRRERPPIQRALKRGQKVLVQVLKEGVGTKGPTLTSYLSIPGRFLVMMPHMDKVGVSRKVEDEDTRRAMREVLDQIELPDGFGFILRTAGFDRTKTELKRDLAYLQRLWKDLDKRLSSKSGPRLLYAESDLLVRTLRDSLTSEVGEVVIDDEQALARAARFLKIVAPRSGVKLTRYTGRRPIFHAFGVEPQLQLMYEREVPLKSGGRLVIDETEAVVAIDVNSGKMRSARDADANALKTNLEAVDEICRQMRLRDIGGIVINDLIDMRLASHRKEVEARFKERLKRDRAKSTTAPISPFGILEMTRQRMRGSLRSQAYAECPSCHGRGGLKRPAAVASDAIRELAHVLDYDKVSRVELVVSPRVAGELLSSRRRSLSRVERASGKRADVRVSETVGADRYTLYAYDEQGADVALDRLPVPPSPESLLVPWADDSTAAEWVEEVVAEADDEPAAAPVEAHPIEIDEPADSEEDEERSESGEGGKKKRKRRRRRRRKEGEGEGREGTDEARGDDAEPAQDSDEPGEPEALDGESAEARAEAEAGEGGKKKRRRRRRRRKGTGDAPLSVAGEALADESDPDGSEGEGAGGAGGRAPDDQHSEERAEADGSGAGEESGDGGASGPAVRKKRRRRGRRSGRSAGARRGEQDGPGEPVAPDAGDRVEPEVSAELKPTAKTSRRRKKAGASSAEKGGAPPASAPAVEPAAPAGPKRRSLYSAARRKLSPSEVNRAAVRKD